jgi:hypothetical protein
VDDDNNLLESHPDLMDPEWRKHAQTDAWLGAKKDRKQLRKQRRPRKQRSGRQWGLAAFVLILAVTTAVIVALGQRSSDADGATPATPAPTSVNPTSVARYAPVDLKHAYARTPADVWKKGVDGITSPAPAAVGAFKADQVAAAYAQVKQVITAARIDPAVLDRHDTKGFLALFAKDAQDYVGPILATKPAGDGKTPDFSGFVTELADGYHLLDQGPRTLGSMSARPGEKPGELAIDVKYVVAYAFDHPHPEGLRGPSEIVSFVRADESYLVRQGKNLAPSSRGLWPDSGGGSFFEAIGCDALKQGFLAPAYSNPDATGVPGGDQELPGAYDPNQPMPQEDTCTAK